jgi:hypothetical protein
VIAGVVALSSLLAGCQAHHVADSASCTAGASVRKVVVVEQRGAVAIEKIGLTPKVLKAEDRCP